MNLNVHENQSAGPSRKRSFAQITQSESPSASPGPPSKRMRTSIRTFCSPATYSPSPSEFGRFAGDGLDFRRPVMSSHDSTRNQEQVTIDLTLDEDTPPPPPRLPVSALPRRDSSLDTRPPQTNRQVSRAPPFTPALATPEVIDLSLLDDEDEPTQNVAQQPVPISPELEFVGSRARTPPQPRHASRRLPPPRTLPSLGELADIIRGATQTMFGNLRYDRDHSDLARLGGPSTTGGQRVTFDPAANLAIYEDVDLDYGLAGFALGLPEEAPQGPPDRTYKAPATARNGFTRTYDEDDVLVCGFCGDELAASDDEVKAQVWIIKQCGHAYCGACAHGRIMTRTSAKDKKKAATAKKPLSFKCCMVPGCEEMVNSKTKMFQIYL